MKKQLKSGINPGVFHLLKSLNILSNNINSKIITESIKN